MKQKTDNKAKKIWLFMKKYNWKNSIICKHIENEKELKAKVVVKTREVDWVNTDKKAVVLISVHSAFHKPFDGEVKMEAMLAAITSCTSQQVTVLFTECAHIQTARLSFSDDYQLTLKNHLQSAHCLSRRYDASFKECSIAFWHLYIQQDTTYTTWLNECEKLYNTNIDFKFCVTKDALSSCAIERIDAYADKELYIKRAVLDVIEQCVSILVLASKGYRFCFYPGNQNQATKFVIEYFLEQEKRLFWINTFIAIEKKFTNKSLYEEKV